MRRHLITVTALMMAVFLPTTSIACSMFDDNQRVTVRGQIVQTATTTESEDHPPYKYTALVLDNPICFSKQSSEKITFIEVGPVSKKWLGHYVTITGNMTAGDAWSIAVRDIKDVTE